MKNLIILLLLSSASYGQLGTDAKGLVVHGDTLWLKNFTAGDSTQLNRTVPTQTGQAGKVLSTNGTTFQWIANSALVAWGSITGTLSEQSDLQSLLNIKAPLASPTFTGTVSGITAAMVGLGNVNNTSDASKPISTATQTALDNKAGYGAGFGGTVTQLTNKSTAVTINKMTGQITMNNAALAAAAEVTFTVNNNLVASTDIPVVAIQSVGTAGSYLATVGSVSNGAFSITISNASAASLSQALVLNFSIIKGSNN